MPDNNAAQPLLLLLIFQRLEEQQGDRDTPARIIGVSELVADGCLPLSPTLTYACISGTTAKQIAPEVGCLSASLRHH